jgi:glycosyltransferase involved in cell wall biosynthesis
MKSKSNIISLGSYNSEKDLYNILIKNNINLLWFPAFRHESFCYTLTLAMQTGLPIVANNSGTFKDRLSFYKSPYKIHECELSCELLFEDINNFWLQLKNNILLSTSDSDNNNFVYDNLNYNSIYDL